MKTIAVGPFEPGVTCCGAIEALPLLHCKLHDERIDVEGAIAVARVAAREKGARRAMVRVSRRSTKDYEADMESKR